MYPLSQGGGPKTHWDGSAILLAPKLPPLSPRGGLFFFFFFEKNIFLIFQKNKNKLHDTKQDLID